MRKRFEPAPPDPGIKPGGIRERALRAVRPPADPGPDLVELAGGPVLTPTQRRALNKSGYRKCHGHAAPVGSGPAGETCGTCAYLIRKQMARDYLKCKLMQAVWTGGYGTDVHARDPACRKLEKRP